MSSKETKVGIKLGHFAVKNTHGDVTTTVLIRRVNAGDSRGEHVQVDITVEKHGEKRTTYGYGALHLSPEQAALVAKALQTLQPQHETYKPMIERDIELAGLYGVDVGVHI